MALMNLIYVSSARTELGTDELTLLLESSVRHNARQRVTGMLLYLNGSFMQVLEGEESAIDETYNRIRRDRRHTGLLLIDHAPVGARSFERWSMGFRHLEDADTAQPAYMPFLRDGFDATAIGAKDGMALDILRNFALGQGG